MKLVDIKGTRGTISFVLEDGTRITGSGELTTRPYRFYVWDSSLSRVIDNKSTPLTQDEIIWLKEEVGRLTDNTEFKVIFEDLRQLFAE